MSAFSDYWTDPENAESIDGPEAVWNAAIRAAAEIQIRIEIQRHGYAKYSDHALILELIDDSTGDASG